MANTCLTLRDLLERNARWYGDRPAVGVEGRSLTHRQVLDHSLQLGSALYRAGVRSQDRVGILAQNSIEYALIYAACEASGYICATVNFRFAPAEMQYVIQDAGSTVLIFDSEYAAQVDQIRSGLKDVRLFVAIGVAPAWATPWDEFIASGDQVGPPLPRPRSEDIAYLIYTSGTTGRPKGCMLDHAAEIATGEFIASTMGLVVEDRTLLMMPMFHIGAKAVANAVTQSGGTYIMQRKFDAADVLRAIETEKISVTHLAPVLVQALLECPDSTRYDIRGLRKVLYSAAAMPPSLLRKALEKFGPIFLQMYGQTEGIGTILPISSHRLDDDPKVRERLSSIGHPFPGCEVTIRDEENREAPQGAVGEICIRGPVQMRGYWNNSPATITTLAGGWLHTGDMGRMDDEGYFYLVDRKKDMIISGGENIYSREVEEALLTHAAVAGAAVIARPDTKWGESVCAVVVLRQEMTATADDLIEHCRNQIASYKRPRSIVFVNELPALPSGKINKPALRQLYATDTG